MGIEFKPGMDGAVGISREALSAEKFKKLIEKKFADVESPEMNESFVRGFVEANARNLMPGVTIDQVMIEFKKGGFIVEPQKPKPSKKEDEMIGYRTPKLKVVHDEVLNKQLEDNKFSETLEKEVFRNEAELNTVYERSLLLGSEGRREIVEGDEYYKEFAHLVKGGQEEIDNDLKSLKERKNLFQEKTEALDPVKSKKSEQAKKVATIVERAIVHSVTNLHWYGDSITIEPTSQFDDVKRGVDDVMQITKEGESSFLALGIDVTYRGLLSNQYREKLFTLLNSINSGYQTKIKYFKNNEGQPMKEFAIPKTILFFDMKDVKDLVYVVKNIDNPEIAEEFKQGSQKIKVMNQLMIQCEILAEFAEEMQNPIFKKYQEVVASIKELSWTNPDIKEILDSRHEDEVSKHVRFLIEEFKAQPSEK